MATARLTSGAGSAGRRKNDYSFTPYQPPPIPTGTYDPSIDAQVGATGRGLQDTLADIATQKSRLTTDYGLGQQSIERNTGRTLEDLTRSRDRGIATLDTQQGREGEDYQRAADMLTRSYKNLAIRQQEGANQLGVVRGGAALQAAAKRAANQGLQQGAADTQHARALADIARSRGQIGEDFTTQTGRLDENKNLQLGELALNSAPPDAQNPLGGRSFQDLLTQGTRAQREGAQFGIDAEGLKAFQAAQAGYVAPQRGQAGGRPSNEFTDANGQPYRLVLTGKERLKVRPNGEVIERRKR